MESKQKSRQVNKVPACNVQLDQAGGRVKSILIWWRRRPAEEQLWPEQSEHVSHIKDKLSSGQQFR